jgi:hypothetical protein
MVSKSIVIGLILNVPERLCVTGSPVNGVVGRW